MLKLLKKELKLDVLSIIYLFPLFGLMTLIPNYPLIVGVGYGVLATFIYFQHMRENLALEFTATLPVKRADIVKSTVLVVVLLQIAFLIVGGIGALIVRFINPVGNLAGMDANFAFFGIALLCYASFNAVFFPWHYKSGYKVGVPLLVGLVAFLVVYGVCETLVQAIPPLTAALDSYVTETIWIRVAVLASGIVLYAISTVLSANKAVKNFERVSL